MRRKYFFGFIAVILAMSLVLGACGGSSDGNPSETSNGQGESSGSTSSGNGNEPVIVRWWSWNPDKEKGKDYVEAFNASHTDVQVEYINYEYNDYVQTLKLEMMSGGEVDIFGLQAGAMLKEYDGFTEDLAPYAVKEWGENWKDRFYELGLSQTSYGEKVSALPWFLSAAGYLYYNNTLLEREGLEPPKTYQEWVELSQTLADRGITPFIHGGKDAWQNFDMFIALANEYAPGKIYEAEAGNIEWTDPDLVKAATTWKEMFENGIMQKGALGAVYYPDSYDKFNKGEAIFTMIGTWNDNRMTKTVLATHREKYGVTEDYEFLTIPFPDVNGDGQPGRVFGGPDVALAMNKNSNNKEAAWTFLKWMVSEGGQEINAKYLMLPSIKGVEMSDEDTLTDRQKEILKQHVSDLDNSVGRRELLYPEIKTALADALQMIASGQMSPEEGMQHVQSVSEELER